MNARSSLLVLSLTVVSLAGKSVQAQVLIQPAAAPTVTAENEPWYLDGAPITYAGHLYYPSGAEIFFSPNEMVRSGFYMGVPLYARTTIEPYSVVYVPVAGGRMQPYERPRTGQLAGTVGSTPSTLPTPPSTVPPGGLTAQAPSPPSETTGGIAFQEPAGSTAPEPESRARPDIPRALGTAGRSTPMPTHTRIGGKPQGTNAIFIERHDGRWYPMGPAQPLDTSRMVPTGDDYKGFRVWSDREDSSVIYIPVTRDGTLAVPYTRTNPRSR